MNEFWYTDDTMNKIHPGAVNFEYFGFEHIIMLLIFTAVIAAAMIFYRRLDGKGREKFLKTVAVLLIADEIVKHVSAAATGQWECGLLPLHLCSINIFVCVINSLKRDDLTSEMLYSLCIPGAVLALIMPTWNNLPHWNVMSLHSNSVHVLLLMYPLLLLAGGFRPSAKRIPKVAAMLLCQCVPIFFINKILDTNFFFLNRTANNPVLELFADIFGKEFFFLGMPFLLAVVWAGMYLPWCLAEKKKAKAK